MMKQPYLYFWVSIPMLILLIFFPGAGEAFDFQLHDTYLVLSRLYFSTIFAVYFGFVGLMYWIFRNIRLRNWMTVAHVVGTVLPPILFMLIVGISGKQFGVELSFDGMFIIGLIWLLLQLIFLINLVGGLIKGNNS